MAKHNIQFKGIRHAPSDITGQDGDLLECVNLVHEGGELKPIEMPEKIPIDGLDVENNALVLAAVHNLADGKMFVFVGYEQIQQGGVGQSIVIIKDESNTPLGSPYYIPGERVQWVEAIGNTLIVGTDYSTYYLLYKNSGYKWLGDKLPQPVFEFDFNRSSDSDAGYWLFEWSPKTTTMTPCGDMVDGGGVALEMSWKSVGDANNSFATRFANSSDENKKLFRDGVISHVASLIGSAKKNNVFVFPFLMRYALRMYDGNYAMHSSPILMVPSSLVCPILAYLKRSDYSNHTDSDGKLYALTQEEVLFHGLNLLVRFMGFCDEEGNYNGVDITDWKDVVKGVDLFMSSQIYSYNERAWDDIHSVPDSFYVFEKTIEDPSGSYVTDATWKDYGVCYSQNKKISWKDIYEKTSVAPFNFRETGKYDNGDVQFDVYKYMKIPLPSYTASQMVERFKDTSLFYKVRQYDLDEVSSRWYLPKEFGQEVEHGILERLETLPILPDDYVSRCRMTGKVNYNYNQRLVLGNIKLQAPKWYQDAKRFNAPDVFYFDLCFIIEKPEKTIVVRWNSNDNGHNNDIGLFDFGHYIYYPDPDCKEVVIEVGNNKKVLQMHEHTGLHGAYALMPDLKSLNEALSSLPNWNDPYLPTPSLDRYYQLQNTVAMSAVANPFHFPAANFKDIGRAKVLGIAANVLDVSYNQWGPFPLYAFCSDGIVAVTIDKEGKFSGEVDAVSADVLKEPRGLSQPTLIQANQMLVFLTQRGVMSIGGTNVRPLSQSMEGRRFNALTDLSPTSPTASVLYNVGAFADLVAKTSDNTAFMDFAASGFLAYDYAHNRVLLLCPDKNYEYVLSLDTMLWSKQVVFTNNSEMQLPNIERSLPTYSLAFQPLVAAVNNYTEMYLQDAAGSLYKTMDVDGENSTKQLYQWGYLISRPVRFGTDEYKSLTRVLHRYTHYANNSFVKMAVYGSRDGVKYGRINTLRGMSYQYYIFVIYTYLKPNERYSYMSVEFEPRLTNKIR